MIDRNQVKIISYVLQNAPRRILTYRALRSKNSQEFQIIITRRVLVSTDLTLLRAFALR